MTYRRLAYVFAIDEALLHEVGEELSFRQIARDEDGKGLVWTGEVQPVTLPAELIDHPFSLTHACFGIGLVYVRKGEFPKAISLLERGHATSQSYSPVAAPVNEAHLGYALTLSNGTSEAIALLEHAIEQAVATRLLFYQSLWVAWLSEAHLLAGHLEPATEFALQVLDLSRHRQERGHEAWTLWLLGEIHAQRDNQALEQAEAYYQQALTLATELGMRPLQAHCHLDLGKLYRQMGRTAQTQAELSTAINLYQTMSMTFWLSGANAVLMQIGASASLEDSSEPSYNS